MLANGIFPILADTDILKLRKLEYNPIWSSFLMVE